ncbi:cell division protein SepF [Effusibacillus dendaii]|uniref:Cell division protein SepF n=1 Tax=Effusibacillus dendaii TaxID=2743772 RepID=A0A7I8D7B5_9BACL|nr:cell division protein SepF [Effusibacillus dendaii]BCJ86058.1 hypothetical protein skT53_10430 [Effusibacillus dendaii]
MWTKLMQFFGLADEAPAEKTQGTDYQEQPSDVVPLQRRAAVVNLHTQKQVRLVLCEPESFEESQQIADHLRGHRPVVLNLHRAQFDHAIRIMDFISGTTYALGGKMEKIGHQIFICVPDTIEVHGAITDLLKQQQEMGAIVSRSQTR